MADEQQSAAGETAGTADNRQTSHASGPTDPWQAEVADLKDKYLRSQAELENYRKRARRENDDIQKYAPLPLLRDLLPVVDLLQKAIESAEKTPDLPSLLQGLKMVQQQAQELLARNHCQRLQALGEPFDPHVHAASGEFPSKDAAPGTVIHVLEDGYRLFDRVVRPARVLVAAAPPAEANG